MTDLVNATDATVHDVSTLIIPPLTDDDRCDGCTSPLCPDCPNGH